MSTLEPLAKNFVSDCYQKSFQLNGSAQEVFAWMQLKKTFTSGQLPPYRVEFLQSFPSEKMQVGDLTTHHGPGILFAGRLTKIHGTYRRLDYNYGSYALSFRWARPTALEVETVPLTDRKCRLIITLSTDVHRCFRPLWRLALILFWNGFQLSTQALWLFRSRP